MYRLDKLHGTMASLEDLSAPLRPFLLRAPYILHTIWDHRSAAQIMSEGRYNVIELLTMEADKLSLEYGISRFSLQDQQCMLDRAAEILPFVRHSQSVSRRHSIRSGCEIARPVGPVRQVYTGHLLQPLTSWLQDANDDESPEKLPLTLAVEWKDLAARRNVQAQQEWRDRFEQPLHLQQKEGKISHVHRWTLQLHQWPLQPRKRCKTLRGWIRGITS